MFKYLLSVGADIKQRSRSGLTMMHKSVIEDNNYLITFLKDKHAFDIEEKDFYGNSPLHLACQYKTKFASYWLVGFGHDVNLQNNNDDTPLHLLFKGSA
jgi:ankyrin repeat protein